MLLVATLAVGVGPAPREVAAAPAAPSAAERYVDATFRLFLGRAPSARDRTKWVPTVELGHLHALSKALSVSDEWAGREVDNLYRTVLRRGADASGRAHWVSAIARGHTLEAIAAFVYGSDEYYHHSGSSAEGFVQRLYRDTLSRPPDASGRSYWVGVLRAGAPRHVVAAGFYDSVENRRRRVRHLYRTVLGREPDVAGGAYWVDTVLRLGDVSLAAHLASSTEFHRRTTGHPPPTPGRGHGTGFQLYARAGGIGLVHPSAVVDLIGFHQSSKTSALSQHSEPLSVKSMVMPSRGRGTDLRSAADIVIPPGLEIRAPVSGTVVVASAYRLYCRHHDEKVVIVPDSASDRRVVMFHIEGLRVRPGDRVVAGVTPIAVKARVLPLSSQVERFTQAPAWPHVHIEVVHPSHASGGGC